MAANLFSWEDALLQKDIEYSTSVSLDEYQD